MNSSISAIRRGIATTHAMVQGQPVTACQPRGMISAALRSVWAQVRQSLGVGGPA